MFLHRFDVLSLQISPSQKTNLGDCLYVRRHYFSYQRFAFIPIKFKRLTKKTPPHTIDGVFFLLR